MQDDPIQFFQKFYAEAQKTADLDVDAVALATVDSAGHPNARIVYFRRLIEGKFCFFTNYESAKGQELKTQEWASLLFLWHPIGQQVRVRGPVSFASPKDSDDYFDGRTQESQISASVSKQSRPLKSFDHFLDEIEAFKKKLGAGKVARPKNWGGYVLDPQSIEFWQKGEHRRHHRELYERNGAEWKKVLLYP